MLWSRISCSVTLSRYSFITLFKPLHSGRVRHPSALSQPSGWKSRQATGVILPSVRRRISPTVYWSGSLASL